MSEAGKSDLLGLIRNGEPMTLRQQLNLTVQLSIPAIMAQLSSILMQFIDASMVGSLGAEASASIGLVSTTTWLFMGVSSAAATGFSVQTAHLLGAKDPENARSVLRQGLSSILIFSIILTSIGLAVSGPLPCWLGGGESILADASGYFRIFILFLPAFQFNVFAGGMLRSSGNMKIPSMLNILMCILDVIFNFFFIFPTRNIDILGLIVRMPGAGLGVEGAALGTAAAMLVTAALMLYYLCFKSNELDIAHYKGTFRPTLKCLKNAAGIGIPMGLERMIMCGAQIMSTVIVAPLGTIAIAANSFAITAESLCYMPDLALCENHRLHGNGCNGSDGCRNVYRSSGNNGNNDSCTGSDRARSIGTADRSLCRTDVCSIDCCLWYFRGSRLDTRPMYHEPRQHVGRPTQYSSYPGSFTRAERSLDSDVHRALLQRTYLPDTALPQELA